MVANELPPKSELEGALENIKNNFILSRVLPEMVDPEGWEALRGITIWIGDPPDGIRFEGDEIADLMSDADDRQIALRELRAGSKRALLRETYEAMEWWTRATGQLDKWQEREEYRLLRITRNTTSHERGEIIHWIDGWEDPVEWRGVRIGPEDEGEVLRMDGETALELHVAVVNFVDEGLTDPG